MFPAFLLTTFVTLFSFSTVDDIEIVKFMDEKHQKIIEGAYRVFIENGIRSVSMDDVCRHLGISKKTLYQVVESKVDLLSKITAYIQEKIKTNIEEFQKMDLNAIDILLEMSKVSSERHIRINPIITHEFRKYYPMVYEEYIEGKKELVVNAIMHNLEQGIKEGLYRQDLNKEIVAYLYFQKIEEFHNLSKQESEDFSYQKIFKVMFENHIRGISNPEGIEYFEKQKEKLNFNI